MQAERHSLRGTPLHCIASLSAVIASAALIALFVHDTNQIALHETAAPLTREQERYLERTLDESYPGRNSLVRELPYKTVPAELSINAGSAILIDAETGSILFEKNADEPIPPASMTKLVEMYVVFEAVENGEVSLDDVVPLPPESWAINLPRDASIMFLAQGQQVTLRELLLGLAIASGNDASVAVANYVCGDMDTFVARMNAVVEGLGLTATHFVESSGYSEENVTTAREFAAFSRVYVSRFPQTLSDYHSQPVLRYPLRHNLPLSQQSQGDGQAVVQYNTNKLLGVLDGCDGIKTGFIYESGYNLALTARRGDRRFISVTMRGPGTGSAQGNRYRTADGTALMEYAFGGFANYHASEREHAAHSVTAGVTGATQKSVMLVPAEEETFTVPFISGSSPEDAAQQVTVTVSAPDVLYGQAVCGRQYGTITYSLGGVTLRTVPLVADRTTAPGSALRRLYGRAQYFFIRTVLTEGTPARRQ